MKTRTTDCIDHGKKGFSGGYGYTRHNGKVRLLHRLAYCKHHEIDIEKIKGAVVRHTCDNPRCVNPLHLLLGTVLDNNQDKARRNRTPRKKLTSEQVAEIRRECSPNPPRNSKPNPYSYKAMGRKLGVSGQCVKLAFLGHTHQFA